MKTCKNIVNNVGFRSAEHVAMLSGVPSRTLYRQFRVDFNSFKNALKKAADEACRIRCTLAGTDVLAEKIKLQNQKTEINKLDIHK